ncbi:undecaprenyl-diphosphate phosphatase [Candidatus Woesearchaeota archaeon]|nr:undecaprenyl-diphosphate phosphatase [Candidatus Woesearchaeota archaeon]
MDYINAIILGIVQSIAEWLPVSSSAHLAIFSKILDVNIDLWYIVLLHLATLISFMLFFRNDIADYFFDFKDKHFTKKGFWIIYASIPIFIAGYFFHDLIEGFFTDFPLIGIALIVNGIILFSTRFFKPDGKLNPGKGIFIGIMQMFALIPGISRSGITVASAHFAKLDAKEVIMFPMMMSLPAILGAVVYKFFTTPFSIDYAMFFGFIVAIIFGYFTLGLLVKNIKKGQFYKYWVYCVVLGIIMLFN